MIEEPEIHFSKWKQFVYRERLSEEFEIPEDVGFLGVYLLASPKPSSQSVQVHELPPEVIYIGMSDHVTRRLDKSHYVVRKYKKELGVESTEKLYYSQGLSRWPNWNENRNIMNAQLAFMHYLERKLIWEYARKHGRLPLYNRR